MLGSRSNAPASAHRIKFDPTTAREQFHRMLLDGKKMTLTPHPDGSWQAVSALLVGRFAGTRKPRSGGPTGASGIATDKVEIGSCAGAIQSLDHLFLQDFRLVMSG